jgi:hypothetical protein
MIVDCSYREAVYGVTKYYFLPLVGTFLVLVVVRLLLVFALSLRQKSIS